MKYVKNTPRINVKFIDALTEETILEVPDRNWMNVSEIFTDTYSDSLIKSKLEGKKLPKKVLILTICELNLI
jgi:uncharacterized FlaG/YvyC family protein